MWFIYALASALFASVTAILIKLGLKGVDNSLATAIRTAVILLISWGVVLATGQVSEISKLPRSSVLFLVLSSVATFGAWFTYNRAMSLGKASQIAVVDKSSMIFTIILAAIFLQEKITFKSVISSILIAAGVVTMIL